MEEKCGGRDGPQGGRPWKDHHGLLLLASLTFLLTATGATRSQTGPPAGDHSKRGMPPIAGNTTNDYNQRLEQLRQMLAPPSSESRASEYRIGPEDLLDISVFEAPELNRSLRATSSGEISLPLLGMVRAAGLTPRQLESVLEELLRRTYMKDPHVGVFVHEMQSHAVSVFGAVSKPGVFQVRGTKTVIEILSMAEGLAPDAGDTVMVMRNAGLPGNAQLNEANETEPPGAAPVDRETSDSARGEQSSTTAASASSTTPAPSTSPGPPHGASTVTINLKALLESGDPSINVPVFPGDVVTVTRAGLVYVVGEVKKPGGFALKSNENISVLQALALAEGLTRTSKKSQARIIRTEAASGQQTEIAVHLGKILAGKAQDLMLRPKDILFVPNSTARSALGRGAEAAVSIVGGVIIYRR